MFPYLMEAFLLPLVLRFQSFVSSFFQTTTTTTTGQNRKPLKLPMRLLALKVREGSHGEVIKVIPMFDFKVLNAK